MKTIKIITLLVFIVLTNALSAQDKFKTARIEFKKVVTYNVESDDTISYISAYYRNMDYDYIIDLGSLYIHTNYDKEVLIGDLEKMLPFIKPKTDATCKRQDYTLMIATGGLYKGIFLFDKKNKYTVLPEREVIGIIEWLKTVEL